MNDLFKKLRLCEKSAIDLSKVEADYVLHVDLQNAESSDDSLIAATSSNYSISLFSKRTMVKQSCITGHENVVTGVKFGHKNPNLLFSSSLDRKIRCWDIRESLQKPSQIYTGFDKTVNTFSCFDLSCDDELLCAGTELESKKSEDVYLLFWDLRAKKAMGYYDSCHMDDITQVRFHPYKDNVMATSSTDGLVCIFDVKENDEDDALQLTLNSESSVSQIGWCGERFESIYCTTHDETFHLWDSEGDTVTNIRNPRESVKDLKIDYLIDSFYDAKEDMQYLAAGTHSGSYHILNVDGDKLKFVKSFDGGHTSDVRCLFWDQKSSSIVTGGEDSILCLWSTAASGHEDKSPKKNGLKLKSAKKETKKSGRPY